MSRPIALRSPAHLPLALAAGLALSACGGGGGGGDAPATAALAATQAPVAATASASPVADVTTTDTTTTTTVTATSPTDTAAVAAASDLAAAMAASAADAPGADSVPAVAPPAPLSKAAADVTTSTDAPPTMTIQALTTTTATTAAVYYVDSSAGNDANNGLAATAGSAGTGPWRSLAKLATVAFKPGDTVRLVCGRTWNETLRLGVSGLAGSRITITSQPAGCTNAPVIDGSTSLPASAWTLHSGSIYKATLATTPLQVFSAAGRMTVAHHPNAGFDTTQPTSVYLRNAAASDSVSLNGRTASTYLTTGTDLRLPTGAAITAGAKVRIRTLAWLMDERSISAVSGTRLTLDVPTSYKLDAGWGYFLLGQRWMLDSAGEWYYDSATKTLYAWMPDGRAPAAAVQATTLAAGVDLASRSYITLDNLTVRRAATGMDLRKSTGIEVRNSLVEDTAEHGLYAVTSTALTVAGSRFYRTGADAISGQEDSTGPATGMQVLNNTLGDIGVTMQGEVNIGLPSRSRAAIRTGTGALVDGNTLTNTGYIGVWVGAASTVRNNSIAGTCTVLDDCGGIYTSGTANNSVISGNVVQNIRGALAGKPSTLAYTQGQGIYLDESASGVTVSNNTVVNADNGIHVHVAANNTFSGNKLYGNRNSQLWMQEQRNVLNPLGDLYGNVVNGNQIVATTATASGLYLETTIKDTTRFATFDTNRYLDTVYPVMAIERTPLVARTAHTFGNWRAALASDGTSRRLDVNGMATSQTRFASVLTNGSTIVPNGSLATDATGWAAWNATAPYGTLSRISCLPGWCARYVAGGSSGIVSSHNFSIVGGTWYRLSVDVATGADAQAVNLVVRRGGGGSNGYESLADRSLNFTASTGWKRYSVLFKAIKTINANDPNTKDLGARVDFQNVTTGQQISVANLELVPIIPADALTRSDLLINAGVGATQVACPVAATQPALCSIYVRLTDNQPVTWPFDLPARSSEIVYTRDVRLVDTDGDGIPEQQDACLATPAGAGVNSRGCALGQ